MCQPKQNIVFLKTHKCASSSVQNVLMRYAHRNNLTLVLPLLPKYHYFSLTKPFRKEMVAGAPWEILGYNILCHHLVFDKSSIEKIMPKDTIYISIIRNPLSVFESLYEYEEMNEVFHMDIEDFARSIKNETVISKLRTGAYVKGRNQMLFDFGVHPAYFNNYAVIQKAIETIENQFDFIMIAEHFDESMIILKHILCWELDDIVSLTINARMKTYKKNLTSEAINNLEEWNQADKILYEHFYRKFKQTIQEYGEEKLMEEVMELKQRRNEWLSYCVKSKVGSKSLPNFKIWSSKVLGYMLQPNIQNVTCEDMVKPEYYFTSELRQQQLVRGLMKGAPVTNYGPYSLRRLIDLRFLKGDEQVYAQNLVQEQHKYRRKIIKVNSKT